MTPSPFTQTGAYSKVQMQSGFVGMAFSTGSQVEQDNVPRPRILMAKNFFITVVSNQRRYYAQIMCQ